MVKCLDFLFFLWSKCFKNRTSKERCLLCDQNFFSLQVGVVSHHSKHFFFFFFFARVLFVMKLFFPQERWEKADLVKNVFLEGFVAFGGGKYQCPGRLAKQTLQSCLYKAVCTRRLLCSFIHTARTDQLTLNLSCNITLYHTSTQALATKLTDILAMRRYPASMKGTCEDAKCHFWTS